MSKKMPLKYPKKYPRTNTRYPRTNARYPRISKNIQAMLSKIASGLYLYYLASKI